MTMLPATVVRFATALVEAAVVSPTASASLLPMQGTAGQSRWVEAQRPGRRRARQARGPAPRRMRAPLTSPGAVCGQWRWAQRSGPAHPARPRPWGRRGTGAGSSDVDSRSSRLALGLPPFPSCLRVLLHLYLKRHTNKRTSILRRKPQK